MLIRQSIKNSKSTTPNQFLIDEEFLGRTYVWLYPSFWKTMQAKPDND